MLSPPYILASRRPSTSRFTPLRTTTCIAAPYNASGDETLELPAHLCCRTLLDARAAVAEEDEVDGVAASLLVAEKRRPRRFWIDAHRLRVELALDGCGVAAGEAQGGEQPERDRLAVRQVEVRRRLERVGERMAEVEVLARPVVARVTEAEGRLERRCPTRVELAPGQQLRLDELRPPLPPLPLRQRLEQRLVEDDASRPVKRADQILAAGDVDACLAPDRRVDLPDESRRHGDPRHAAEIRRGGEARDVGRATAPERDYGAAAVEAELAPDACDDGRVLGLLARGQLVRRLQPRTERFLRTRAVDPHHVRVGNERRRAVARHELAEPVEAAALPVDTRRGEGRTLGIVRDRVSDLSVQRPALGVETPELALVLSERPTGAAGAPPREIDVDVDQDHEVLGDALPGLGARDGPAAEREHRRVGACEGEAHGVLLDPPELLLSPLGEELADRLAGALLDRSVEIEEGTFEPLGQLPPERRLARAHEADEDDVAPERVQRQPMRSRYARQEPTKSPTASPPNFSCAARASSHATAASATTASASTAATSDRSTSACAGSPVSRSTEARGFISVGSGFIAARTTISSPFDVPASSPPA